MLFERSEGLFLYIRVISERLRDMKQITLNIIDDLPDSLNDAFKEVASKLKKELGSVYGRIINAVGTAQEPLHRTILEHLLEDRTGPMDPQALQKRLMQCRDLITITDDDKVRFLHKRVHDWLTADGVSNDLGVDTADGHRLLAEFCSKHRDDPYSVEHGVYHLAAAGRAEEAKEWMRDVDWLVNRIASSKSGRSLACASCAADAERVGDRLMKSLLELAANAGEQLAPYPVPAFGCVDFVMHVCSG